MIKKGGHVFNFELNNMIIDRDFEKNLSTEEIMKIIFYLKYLTIQISNVRIKFVLSL